MFTHRMKFFVLLLLSMVWLSEQGVVRRDSGEEPEQKLLPDFPDIPAFPEDCFIMTRAQLLFYTQGGCNVTHHKDAPCFEITNCPEPTQCRDRDNNVRNKDTPWLAMDGEQSCECESPTSIYYFAGVGPDGAPPYPLQEYCRTNGCPLHNHNGKDKLYAEGEKAKMNGYDCTCTAGPDKTMMDVATLFHWACKPIVIILPEKVANSTEKDEFNEDKASIDVKVIPEDSSEDEKKASIDVKVEENEVIKPSIDVKVTDKRGSVDSSVPHEEPDAESDLNLPNMDPKVRGLF